MNQKKVIHQNEITDFIPRVGDIHMIDFPDNGEFCLNGIHPGVIYRKVGSNYRVVPITENKDNLHWCEYPVEKGRCGMYKDSKLKLDQIGPVSKEKIKRKLGTADREIIGAISKYLVLEAEGLRKRAA
jgi:mRNA-degrading endonuclease toxin of MazEF toxin-antitoxin module